MKSENVLAVIGKTRSEGNHTVYASGIMKAWQVQQAAKDFIIAQVMRRYK